MPVTKDLRKLSQTITIKFSDGRTASFMGCVAVLPVEMTPEKMPQIVGVHFGPIVPLPPGAMWTPDLIRNQARIQPASDILGPGGELLCPDEPPPPLALHEQPVSATIQGTLHPTEKERPA